MTDPTPAPGASPRPWQPVTIHGITIGVGFFVDNYPQVFEMVANTLLDGNSEPERAADSHKRAVEISRDHNDRAAHLALLRRALDACYGDTWQTCNPNHLADWAREIRAALALAAATIDGKDGKP